MERRGRSLLAVLMLLCARHSCAMDVLIEPKNPANQASPSLACLRDASFHIQTSYNHAPSRCHEVEGNWGGNFLIVNRTAKFFFADPAPPSHECINRTCYRCTVNDEETEGFLETNIFGPPIAPGDYSEVFAPQPSLGTDKINSVGLEVVIAENFSLEHCARGSGGIDNTGVPVVSPVNFIVRIPDLGQTRKLVKDAATDGKEALVGQSVTLRARVLRSVSSGGVLSDEALDGFSVVFTPKDPAGNPIGSPVAATSGADGFVSFGLALNGGAGTYTVDAVCSACSAGTSQSFTATAFTPASVTELREFFCDGTGFFAEEMPYPLRVRALNRLDNSPVKDMDVLFEITQPFAGSALLAGGEVVASVAAKTGPEGIARAALRLGPKQSAETASLAVTATCAKCEAGTTVQCPVGIVAAPRRRHDAPPILPIEKGGKKGSAAGVTVSITPEVVAPSGTAGPGTANVEIRGEAGTAFTARVKAVEHSGGHQHPGRPTGHFSAGGNEVAGTIGASGAQTLLYTPPEAGGEEYVELEMADGSVVRAFVFVRVLGMQRFPKRGAHHTSMSGDSKHPQFTYGRQSVIDAINVLAEEYHVNRSSGTRIISLNDMSLISGGLFEGHVSHRVGIDVDINSIPRDANTRRTRPDERFVTRLCEIIKEKAPTCCKIVEEGSIHFRCPCGGATDDCVNFLGK